RGQRVHGDPDNRVSGDTWRSSARASPGRGQSWSPPRTARRTTLFDDDRLRRTNAEHAVTERRAARKPSIEVARKPVCEPNAEASRHGRGAEGTEGTPPRDLPSEPHAPLGPWRPQLEPDFFARIGRGQGAYVRSAGADVVREADLVLRPTRDPEDDAGAVEQARARALVDAARREKLVDDEEDVLGRREGVHRGDPPERPDRGHAFGDLLRRSHEDPWHERAARACPLQSGQGATFWKVARSHDDAHAVSHGLFGEVRGEANREPAVVERPADDRSPPGYGSCDDRLRKCVRRSLDDRLRRRRRRGWKRPDTLEHRERRRDAHEIVSSPREELEKRDVARFLRHAEHWHARQPRLRPNLGKRQLGTGRVHLHDDRRRSRGIQRRGSPLTPTDHDERELRRLRRVPDPLRRCLIERADDQQVGRFTSHHDFPSPRSGTSRANSAAILAPAGAYLIESALSFLGAKEDAF